MALLSRKQIDAATDIDTEDVPMPEWGGTVRVRGMTGTERSAVEATMIASRGQKFEVRADALKTIRERTVATCLVDENGGRLYGDKEISALGRKSAQSIQRLFDVAQRLSGMSEAETAAIEGNSEAAPSGNSDSA